MIIEVLGVWEHNRGAMLMLEAIRQKAAEMFPHAKLAVPGSMSKATRKRLGLLGVRERSSRKQTVKKWAGLDSFVEENEVDFILDASGFGYGDYWGEEKLRTRLADRVRRWKTPERGLVLLPQALGPFSSEGIRNDFALVLREADAVFARDDTSYAHCADVAESGNSSLNQSPDFTNVLSLQGREQFERFSDYGFVIPNEKVTKNASPDEHAAYVRLLADVVLKLRDAGMPHAILLHEGANDRRIVDEIKAVVGDVEVVDLPDALDTKAAIGQSRLIVSSRFHGLVSALSAGVPAIACGWSHKYLELMRDYGLEEFNLSASDPEGFLAGVDDLIVKSANEDFRQSIKDRSSEQKAKSAKMWEMVAAIINART